MNTPDWLKPGIDGAVNRAVFDGIGGSTSGGLARGGTAPDRAMAMSRTNAVASMVPGCPDNARSDPERADKMETIRAASTYQRRDAVMSAGWATVPGTDAPDRDIVQACLAALDVYGSPEPAGTAVDGG